MTKERKRDNPDKNLFRAMNYEYAAEIGIIDNEEMKNNEKLCQKKDENRKKRK